MCRPKIRKGTKIIYITSMKFLALTIFLGALGATSAISLRSYRQAELKKPSAVKRTACGCTCSINFSAGKKARTRFVKLASAMKKASNCSAFLEANAPELEGQTPSCAIIEMALSGLPGGTPGHPTCTGNYVSGVTTPPTAASTAPRTGRIVKSACGCTCGIDVGAGSAATAQFSALAKGMNEASSCSAFLEANAPDLKGQTLSCDTIQQALNGLPGDTPVNPTCTGNYVS